MSSSSSRSCSSAGDCQPPQLKLYQTFIFATPILFTIVLLLLFCLLYLRRRRNAAVVSQIRAQFFARGLFAGNQDHGLNKSFRDSLPTITVDEKFHESRSDTQCAVCLADYQLNDRLVQLPGCGHAFHRECIDQWLATNSTCPICRTSLLHASKVVPLASSPPPPPAPPPPPPPPPPDQRIQIQQIQQLPEQSVEPRPEVPSEHHIVQIER